jgi:hypothetical protein
MKKYSDKFLNRHAELKKAVIGFEFEFYVKELSYYKTLELLNKELSPVRVHGFRQYHSSFVPDQDNFKIEPDLSGGSNMVELVTGPLPYDMAKYYLLRVIRFINLHGYTNERCSLHINISFADMDKDLNDLNILKLILNTDEEEIYRYYPSRKGNPYAKSVKTIIPYKQYDYFNVPIDSVRNTMRFSSDKYFGINFVNILENRDKQRIEYRYIGGTGYEKNPGHLVYFLDRFITDSLSCVDASFTYADAALLEEYLETNIHRFKSFNKYDNFLVEYPDVILQVDRDGAYEVVDSNFQRFYDELFELMECLPDLKDTILNFDTQRGVFEVVDGVIKPVSTLKKTELVNCVVESGIFEKCNLHGCEVIGSQLLKSSVHASEVKNSKLYSCHVDDTLMTGCYFVGGFMNGQMEGGVLRSGELGPYSMVSPETKVVTDMEDNFFRTKFDTEGVEHDKDATIIKFQKK